MSTVELVDARDENNAPLTERFTRCPLCETDVASATVLAQVDVTGHPSYHPELPSRMGWLRCASCAHVFTDSYRTPLGDEVMFSAALPNQVPSPDHSEQQRNLWAPTVHRVAQCLSETRGRTAVFGARGEARPTWGDIGFGGGGLVMTAQEFGFSAFGLDARLEAVKGLKALGYQAACGTFAQLRVSKPVDVLSMADVLEHLPNPRAALDKARSTLVSNGLLYISCPNSETITWRLWDHLKKNPYWREVEHYHNFSRAKLVELLEQHGFSVIDYYVSARYFSCMEIIARRNE